MKILTALFLLLSYTKVAPVAAQEGDYLLKPEWTTPLKVGDKLPDVTFATRTRIESDDENPFDWKSKCLLETVSVRS